VGGDDPTPGRKKDHTSCVWRTVEPASMSFRSAPMDASIRDLSGSLINS